MATRLPLQGQARRYRLLLFGPFTIYRDGVVVDTGSWQHSAVSLLKLLATAPGWRRSRDELIDSLWPDSAPDAGSSSLRSALHVLRRGLGGGDPSPVLYERGWMELNRAYSWEVDLEAFEELLRSLDAGPTRPEEVLALYRGEILREDRYDDWAIPIRERTHRLWRDAALCVAHPLMESGDAPAACECLSSVLDFDPYDEEVLRALLHALLVAGRRTEAIRRYQLYEQQLHTEMDLAPEPETLAIVDRIKKQMPHKGGENEQSGAQLDVPPAGHALSERASLPPERTSFVGRERETAALQRLLAQPEVHLVTLTGPGGSGKTRLAVQVARNLPPSFPDGIVFVTLAPVADPRVVPSTIGAALGIRDAGSRSMQALLQAHLRDKRILLVLDNLEHLLAAAPDIAGLLDTGAHLRILATSRASLHVHGEHEFPVPPLEVPEPGAASEIDRLLECASVQLFSERARASQPSFRLTKTNAAAIAGICIRLEGLPLSLELAATRIRALPPDRVLERLQQRLPLLTGGPRDAPARQRTVKATIEWSYDLLSPEDRRLFTRLAVFAGGFNLEAAEQVCDADLNTLESLLGQSLLRRTEEGRFFYLETIREFALEKLAESGEAGEMRRRHAEHYRALAEAANLTVEAQGEMRHDIVIRDRDNVRGALEWALKAGEIELGLDFASALENYWVTSSPREGKRWLSELLERAGDGLRGELRARALRAYGSAALICGHFEEGRRCYEASLAEYRRIGDECGIGIMLQRLAVEELRSGDWKAARALVEESLRLHRKISFTKGEATALGTLAQVELRDGREEVAFALFERSATLAAETGHTWWRANMLLTLSELLLERGRMPESEARAREALPLVMIMKDRQNTICAVALLARLAAQTGQQLRAGRLWGAVEAEEARAPVGQWEAQRGKYAERVLADAGPELERGRQEGRQLSLSKAVADLLEEPEVTR